MSGTDSAGMSNDMLGLNPNRRMSPGFDATIDGFRVSRPLRKVSECPFRWEILKIQFFLLPTKN